jgi:Cys-rich repeat protein
MSYPSRAGWTVVVGMFFLSSCIWAGDWRDPQDSAQSCSSTSQCPQGSVCQAGSCNQAPPCAFPWDCSYGQLCIDQVCQPPCASDLDCQAGESCRSGQCVPGNRSTGTSPASPSTSCPGTPAICNDSSQCAKLQSCINGACVQVCAKDSDCLSGLRCQNQYCAQPGSDGGTPNGVGYDGGAPSDSPCLFNTDCGPGSFCINQVCYLGCLSNHDCPEGEWCPNDICQPRPHGSCANAKDCPSNYDCVDATCHSKCSKNNPCASGQLCQFGYCYSSSPDAG